MQFSFDGFDRYEIPVLKLANPNFKSIAIIKQPRALSLTPRLLSTSEASFTAREYDANGDACFYYDLLKRYRMVHVAGFGWFTITEVAEDHDGFCGVKTVSLQSYEYTLGRKDIDLDAGTYKLYDTVDNAETLLGRIVAKYPRWSIGYVSTELCNKYRTFDMPDDSVYGFLTGEAAQAYECLFIFDCENFTINAYTAADIVRDSEIVLRYQSILKSANVTDSSDDVVTALKCYGASDFSIADVNPLGTPYIYRFDHFKDDMSSGLWSAVSAWQEAVKTATEDTSAGSYSALLTALKTANANILGYQAQQSDIDAFAASATTAMSVNSPYTLATATIGAIDNIESWINGLSSAALLEIMADAVQYPPIDFASPPAAIATYVAAITEADLPVAQAICNDTACQVANGYLSTSIEAEETTIGSATVASSLKGQIAAIHTNLSFANNFTADQLIELDEFVISHVYENDYIVKLDSYDFGQVQDLAKELYNYGKEILAAASEPAYTVTATLRNFLFDKACADYIGRLETAGLGCKIRAELKDGKWISPLLLEFTVNYDDPADITIGLGSNYKANFLGDRFQDLFAESAKTSSTVSNSLSQLIAPTRSGGTISKAAEFMRSALDASKNAIISSSKQEVTFDQSGILGRRRNQADTGFEDEQIKITNNRIVLTDDNWRTAKCVIGKIPLGNGNYKHGILAELLAGNIIIGDSLTIANSGNTFTVDANGATLTNGTFELTTSDALKRILINPTTGFKIQSRLLSSGNFADKFYIDTETGNVVMNDLVANNGDFSGRINAVSGVLGSIVASSVGATLSGNIVIDGNLSVTGTFPGAPVTPAGAGLSNVGDYIVTSAQSDKFGTMEIKHLTVTDGSSTYDLLLLDENRAPGSGGGGGGTGVAVHNVVMQNHSTYYTLRATASTNSSSTGSHMDSDVWYIYTAVDNGWYYITHSCIYSPADSGGSVSNMTPVAHPGWAGLGSVAHVYTNRPEV